MNKRKLSNVLDLLSWLHEEGGDASAWAEQMEGAPCFDVGRFPFKKELLPEIERRWPELFKLVRPSMLFVWPGFALLHVRMEGEDVIGRAAVFDKDKTWCFPRQARFHRTPAGVDYECYAMGAEDVALADDMIGFIPELYLAALDALAARVACAITQKDWRRFSCLIAPRAERAA